MVVKDYIIDSCIIYTVLLIILEFVCVCVYVICAYEHAHACTDL